MCVLIGCVVISNNPSAFPMIDWLISDTTCTALNYLSRTLAPVATLPLPESSGSASCHQWSAWFLLAERCRWLGPLAAQLTVYEVVFVVAARHREGPDVTQLPEEKTLRLYNWLQLRKKNSNLFSTISQHCTWWKSFHVEDKEYPALPMWWLLMNWRYKPGDQQQRHLLKYPQLFRFHTRMFKIIF